jgi:hypothetical protein
MKSWKEQLQGLKHALHISKPDAGREREPIKVDFQPPQSWLEHDPPMSKTDGTQSKEPRAASASTTSSRLSNTSENGGTPADTKVPATLGVAPSVHLKTATPPDAATPGLSFRPRIDASRSLVTPTWVERGRSLQHPNHRGGKALPMVVRIGIDFGTAFTKVAIKVGAELVPIDWSAVTGDEAPAGRYVLPGVVALTPGGEYCWHRASQADLRSNLKLPVVDIVGSSHVPAATLAYLALVIRYCRAFLYQHPDIGRKLATRTLRWELNIGCPTEPHERPEIVQQFKHIAQTAWGLAANGRLLESEITAAWRTSETDVGLEAEPGVVPEFVAQIAGYLKSSQVTEGLHALVDIGAATLDVATFNVVLRNDGDSTPRIPIFFSTVRPLGTHYLRHDRHSRLGLDLGWDDAVPVELTNAFAQRHGKPLGDVDLVDCEFVERVASCLSKVIDETRTNAGGDPRSLAWSKGLPLFVAGGGAACEIYRTAIGVGERKLKARLASSPNFRFIELGLLGTEAPNLGIEAATRLTVAIGLTEDSENIARVIPHRDIERITHTERPRLDHSELYGDR